MLHTHSSRHEVVQNKHISISCVVPVYNEATLIVSFLTQLHQTLTALTDHLEIIVVDDGSRDATVHQVLPLTKCLPVKLLGLSRNFGKEIALTAGIEHASGEVVILIDADFQHPFEMIPVFLEKWALGYDMVYGVRDRNRETFIKRYLSHIFYWLMRHIAKIDLPRDAGDFRLIDKKIVCALKQLQERTRFMKGLYAWVGYQKIAVPYHVQVRRTGQSTWRWRQLTELAVTGITSFSDVPLRVWGWIGFMASSIALLYAIYLMTVTLLYGTDLPGFPTVVVAVLFLGGIQLLSIGILGEYIARIFTEVKQRPKYLLAIKEGFDRETLD